MKTIPVIALLALTLVACPPVKPPEKDPSPPIVDGGPATCEAACERLRAFPCSEGVSPACEYACNDAIGVLLPTTWPACVLTAEGRAGLQACNVRCR